MGHTVGLRDSLKLGRIAGIPIGANWSIIAVAAYLAASLGVVALPEWFPSSDTRSHVAVAIASTILFFLSIIFHELGHALFARRHGIEVDGITLWILGGFARLRQQAPTPKAEFQVAAAGPAASFILAFGFAGIAIGLDRWANAQLIAGALSWLAIVNALIAVSNLIPVSPLDGGRVLTALLWWRNGDAEHSRVLTARAGLVSGLTMIGGLTAAYLLSDRVEAWWAVLGVATGAFLAHGAIEEIRGAVIRRRLDSTPTLVLMAVNPPPVSDSLTVSQFLAQLRDQPDNQAPACPVVRWDYEPIGYVAPGPLRSIPQEEQSWMTLGAVMTPAPQVARAWTNETIATVLDRMTEDGHSLIVIHDPSDGRPSGTLTRRQLDELFLLPTFWGRDRPVTVPTSLPPELTPIRH